jgi:hypothetical protein
MKISFCGKCGTELLPDTSFCAYCGWKLPDEAERKIIESLNDSKQSNTDSSVVMPIESLATDNITEPSDVKKCISCVASLPQSAEFCSQCGAKQVEVTLPSGKYCSNCGNLMSLNDMFCSNCGANQNAEAKRQYDQADQNVNIQQQYYAQANQNAEVKRQYDQVAPAVNTPKKKANGGIILISVMLLFIASIVGAVLFFGIGGVKADEVSGKWVVEFIIEDMSDDMDYYDFSDYIGETTEGTLIVDLDEDGNGTAKLVTTVDGTDYDYEVMEAQYDKGKLVCIADTKSESIEFTGNVRRKGDIYKLSGKFKMSFIEDVKTLSSGKWTATKDVNQTANSKQANSSSKKEKAVNEQSQKEEIPNLAINATMLDILGEWEGTAILSSFTGYEENRAWLLENNAPEDVIEQFDNMKGKESPIYLEIDDDYAWEVAVDVEPMGELSISDSDFGYDEAGNEIDGTMKLEKGSFQLAHSEREEGGSVAFSFSGSVLTNDDGSYAIKGSLTVSMTFDEGLVPFEMMFDYDMLRSVNTEE